MDPNRVFTLVVEVLIVWLAVTVHEACHAWAARSRGDSTAADQGHATLNPLPHLDLFGSVLLPTLLSSLGALVFGWGRPAPLDTTKLRRPDRDDVFVILAGVVGNAVLALVAVVALAVAARLLGSEARQAGTLVLTFQIEKAAKLAGFPVLFTLVRLATINAFLVIFNLLPLPPLDGGRLALIYLPPDWGARLANVSPYGRMCFILASAFLLAWPFVFISYLFLNLIIAKP